MLDDVFGFGRDEASKAENAWFRVDRRCVVAYKRKIAAQMSVMREIFDSWTSSAFDDRPPLDMCNGNDRRCNNPVDVNGYLGHVKPVYYESRP